MVMGSKTSTETGLCRLTGLMQTMLMYILVFLCTKRTCEGRQERMKEETVNKKGRLIINKKWSDEERKKGEED